MINRQIKRCATTIRTVSAFMEQTASSRADRMLIVVRRDCLFLPATPRMLVSTIPENQARPFSSLPIVGQEQAHLRPRLPPAPPLPMSREEMEARGWDEVDVVFVTGDAYVDHPSFAMALLGRLLESEGFRVAILSQPDWRSCEPWRTFGRPRLFFAISAGNMDSMINHYTANRKVRNDDAYSPGGQIGRRPDRATLAYCQRAREAYKGVPVIAGGVEASLRRIAHYDYWSDKVRRSIMLDCQGRPGGVRHGRAADRARSPAGWPTGKTLQGPARHPRRGLSPGGQRDAARLDGAEQTHRRCPSFEEVVRPTSWPSPR